MTITVDLGRKATKQTKTNKNMVFLRFSNGVLFIQAWCLVKATQQIVGSSN